MVTDHFFGNYPKTKKKIGDSISFDRNETEKYEFCFVSNLLFKK